MINNKKWPDRFAEGGARDVQRYLDSCNATPLPPEQIARMSWSERLDYARRFDQTKMPAWKDPRL
jgi:hypothetical protein